MSIARAVARRGGNRFCHRMAERDQNVLRAAFFCSILERYAKEFQAKIVSFVRSLLERHLPKLQNRCLKVFEFRSGDEQGMLTS